jgi:hypothetical protein
MVSGMPGVLPRAALMADCNLTGHIVRRQHGHISVLHEFEEVRLHSTPGNIASPALLRSSQLIDLVEVDDAMGSTLHIATSPTDEVTHKVVHIAAYIAGFAEFGGVRFDEGNADQVCCRADQMRFTNASGAEQEDILFLIKGSLFALQGESHMLEMVAKSNTENFLRFILADDKAVQVPCDVCGLQPKGKILRGSGFTSHGCLGECLVANRAKFLGDASCDRSKRGGFHELWSSLSMATRRS